MRETKLAAREVLVFRLGETRLSLPLESVVEVLPLPLLHQPPGLPCLLEGFLNLGGEAVPVVRLDRLFRLAEMSPGLYTPLVLLRAPGHPVALLVDAVLGVGPADAGTATPLPEGTTLNECVTGYVVWKGETVPVLSPEHLLLTRERACVEQLRSLEAARLADLPS